MKTIALMEVLQLLRIECDLHDQIKLPTLFTQANVLNKS